jgi:hypothetical protein
MRNVLRSPANDVGNPVPTALIVPTLDPSAVAAHGDDSLRVDILFIQMRGTCNNNILIDLKGVVDEHSSPLCKRVDDHLEFPEAFRTGTLVRVDKRSAGSENALEGLLIIFP